MRTLTATQAQALELVADDNLRVGRAAGMGVYNCFRQMFVVGRIREATVDALMDRGLVRLEGTRVGWNVVLTDAGRAYMAAK